MRQKNAVRLTRSVACSSFYTGITTLTLSMRLTLSQGSASVIQPLRPLAISRFSRHRDPTQTSKLFCEGQEAAVKYGSRAAVLRRNEGTRFSYRSDDEVGGCQARSARSERSERSNQTR
jgi:hypothetical protein